MAYTYKKRSVGTLGYLPPSCLSLGAAKPEEPVLPGSDWPIFQIGVLPTIEGFAQYASNVAQSQAAQTEDEEIPLHETDRDEERREPTITDKLHHYAPHITIASTVIGLTTFVIWFFARKRN